MLTTRSKRQLIAFGVLATTTLTYSATAYLDAPSLLGIGTYTIVVDLEESGGLYEGAVATLSGSPVGEVTSIRATKTGASAVVGVDDGTRIPTDAQAQIRSISAAGEQYIDFTSQDPDGPYLAEGARLPAAQVTTSVDTSELLSNLDSLVRSVPTDSLDTTVIELGEGLRTGSRDLQTILDRLLELQDTFTDNLDPTLQMLDDLQPVLQTQQISDPQLRTLASNLADFSDQLAKDDAALRGTVEDLPPLASEVSGLVDDLGPTLPVLLGSLASLGQVTTVYDAAIRQTLTVLPGVTNAFQQAINTSPVDGAVSLFARTLATDPPSCTDGFVQKRRSPAEVTPATPPTSVYCQVEPGSSQAVRGARNYQCPNGADRGPTAASCGLLFQAPEETTAVQEEALATQMDVARRQRAEPDGKLSSNLDSVSPSLLADLSAPVPSLPEVGYADATPTTWQEYLLAPLGTP